MGFDGLRRGFVIVAEWAASFLLTALLSISLQALNLIWGGLDIYA